MEHAPHRCRFICFESLCENSKEEWQSICDFVGISPELNEADELRASIKELPAQDTYSESVLDKANMLYSSMRSRIHVKSDDS